LGAKSAKNSRDGAFTRSDAAGKPY